MKISEQRYYREILSLVGTEIELLLRSRPAPVRGVIASTNFDSFILETEGGRQLIRFQDIYELVPLVSKASQGEAERR